VFYPERSHEPVNVEVTVIGLSEKKVTVDANHPLAGEGRYFDIRV